MVGPVPRAATASRVTSIADALELPSVSRGIPRVAWGEQHLDRAVRWAHVMELPDPRRLLVGGELVLTTGMVLVDDGALQRRWVAALAEQAAAGVVLELGLWFRTAAPRSLLEACRAHDLPLVTLGRRTRYVEVAEDINALVLDRRATVLRRADALQRRLVAALVEERGMVHLLEMLADEAGIPVVLEDAERRLVHAACGGVPVDVVMRALDDLHRYEQRGAGNDGAFVVDVPARTMSWGRLVALGVDAPLDDFQRTAVERAASAVGLDRVTQAQAERLRTRTRGALLADLLAGRVEAADVPRRTALLGFPERPGPVHVLSARRRVPADAGGGPAADAPRPEWADLAAPLRAGFEEQGATALFGASGNDLLGLVGVRGEGPASPADRIAARFHDVLAAHGLQQHEVALAVGGPADGWDAVGDALRRAQRRGAAAAVAAEPQAYYPVSGSGVAELLHDLRASTELAGYVHEQLGPLLEDGSARSDVLLETIRALVRSGGRKAEAARALHLDRASLYPRLRRIEGQLGVDLANPATLLALHLAIEALPIVRSRAGDLD